MEQKETQSAAQPGGAAGSVLSMPLREALAVAEAEVVREHVERAPLIRGPSVGIELHDRIPREPAVRRLDIAVRRKAAVIASRKRTVEVQPNCIRSEIGLTPLSKLGSSAGIGSH
jgi:hypothetical protein